ncbi:MAG: MBL fold metallo-hydrolase [Clostridiales bacterium]|nr:MBL fold metallo-hydrolase [Clostridiales bacterium]
MKKSLLTWILASVLLFTASCGAETGGAELSLLAINVRKADALLLRGGGSAYLIDTGAKKSADALLDALRAEGVTRLDGVILTHTHADHAGGLRSLLESGITVEKIYAPAYYVLKKEDGKHPVEKAINKTGYPEENVIWLRAGDTLPLDGGKLTVIGPLEKNEEAENNNSLVLLAEGGGGSMLLTGDMEFPEESSLLNAGAIPHADVLKVANHGEGDATSTALISAVCPSLAVISTNSEDEPDTPDPRVISLLRNWDVDVRITQDAVTGVLVTLRNGEISVEMK